MKNFFLHFFFISKKTEAILGLTPPTTKQKTTFFL